MLDTKKFYALIINSYMLQQLHPSIDFLEAAIAWELYRFY